jgi:hypothetical protein
MDNLLAGSFSRPGRVIFSEFIFADSFRMVLNTFSVILGATILISVVIPLFPISVTIVSVFYALTAAVYRASARETKVRPSCRR